MSMIKKLCKYFVDPAYRVNMNSRLGLYDHLSDEALLKKRYKVYFNRELNLDSPQTFNEKLQWLKLHDHRPEYTVMVDKYAVKQYVAEKIGAEYIIPTLGVWDKFEDIDFDSLPDQFVLKCTHDSGGLLICRNKKSFDKAKAHKKIECSLKRDFYLRGREWPYKDVPRRIIAEKYMEDSKSKDLRDYKFYCFNGNPEFLYLSESLANHANARISFVSKKWQKMPFSRHDYSAFDELPSRPLNFELMLELSKKLSNGIPFVRVDLYEINGKVYFGELTFYPGSGFTPLSPDEWDYTLGSWLILPSQTPGQRGNS